tara:strand:+ start:127 stop:537 length:411 start_codon:yes stop_codon:yes gene_type:complete
LKDHRSNWQRKPKALTRDEAIIHDDFTKSPLTARQAIWAYVEEDIPIPNELKPILLNILQEPFKGEPTAVKRRYWTLLVTEVIFMATEEGITQTEAIERVAVLYDEKVDTLTRRYNDGNFRSLRSNMLKRLRQDAE